MTRTPHRANEDRNRIAMAAFTGLFAGITRAITGWLLEYLSN